MFIYVHLKMVQRSIFICLNTFSFIQVCYTYVEHVIMILHDVWFNINIIKG